MDSAVEAGREHIRKTLMRRFALGIALIAALIGATAAEVSRLFRDHASHAEIINVAGAQRMLSQRIALLSTELSASVTPAEQGALKGHLASAIARMRAGHVRLTKGRDGAPPAQATEQLRLWYADAGEGLDRRVLDFLSLAEAVLDNSSKESATALSDVREDLLVDLDLAVSLYESIIERHEMQDQMVHLVFVGVTLGTLLLLAVFVFRPALRGAAAAFENVDQALKERTQVLSQVLRMAKMGHWRILDSRRHEIWLSQELISMQRLPLKEGFYPLASLMSGFKPEEVQAQSEVIAAVRQDGVTRELQIVGRRGDGSAVDLDLIFYTLRDETGKSIGLCGIQRDISDEVAVQRSADAHRGDLIEAQKLGRIVTWRWRFGAQDVECTAEAFALLGFSEETFYPSLVAISALYHPDDYPALDAKFQDIAMHGGAFEHGVRIRHADGFYLDVIVRAKAETDDAGAITGLFGSFQDVTAAKAFERRLAARERDLAEAQALGKIAQWRLVLDDLAIEWDEQTYALLAMNPKDFAPTVDAMRGLYLDDGQQKLEAICQGLIETGHAPPCDVRILCGDGVVRDLIVRAKLETNKDGLPLSIFGTFQDVSESKAAGRELEQLAYFDHLTGLANRALFKRELKRACDQAVFDSRSRAVLMLGLDYFKDVNDGLGHAAGDELLQVVSQRLSGQVNGQCLVARLGGDEFAILVHDADAIDMDAFGATIISTLSEGVHLARGEVAVSASIGLVRIPSDAKDPDEAMRCADLALYAAKENGRGRIRQFDPMLNAVMQSRLSVARDMRAGIQRSEFTPYFQPLIDLKANRVKGFEVLLRWRHPVRGFVPPTEFIPIAESSHLIAELGAYVLRVSCEAAQAWNKAGFSGREVAVNVSAAQVWHGDLEASVEDALSVSGLDPSQLCLELTESVFAAEALSRLEGILKRLKHRGVRLALDDFGTGYSSLGYLNRLPFDKLKIDRCFVSGVDFSPAKQRLLRGIVALGQGLGMSVVAEGVETEGELAVVTDLGCDLVQGWYFAKPLPDQEAVVRAAEIDARAMLSPFLPQALATTTPRGSRSA